MAGITSWNTTPPLPARAAQALCGQPAALDRSRPDPVHDGRAQGDQFSSRSRRASAKRGSQVGPRSLVDWACVRLRTPLAASSRAPKILAHSGELAVSTSLRVVALCALTAAACGPFASGEMPGDEEAASAGRDPSAPDAGAFAGDAGSPGATDGGVAAGPPDAGGTPDAGPAPRPRQVYLAHDLDVEGLRADVIWAHAVKAKELRCGEVIVVGDHDLPAPGPQNVSGGVISADEARVHDIHADWIEADTLYVRKLEVK